MFYTKVKQVLVWSIIFKIVYLLIPIEYSNNEFREIIRLVQNGYLIVLFFVYSVAFFIKIETWLKIVLIIPGSLLFLILSLFTLGISICAFREGGAVYVEKKGSAEIVRRSINCGATTDYSYNTHYILPLTPFFNFIWYYDTDSIDLEKWEKPDKRKSD